MTIKIKKLSNVLKNILSKYNNNKKIIFHISYLFFNKYREFLLIKFGIFVLIFVILFFKLSFFFDRIFITYWSSFYFGLSINKRIYTFNQIFLCFAFYILPLVFGLFEEDAYIMF